MRQPLNTSASLTPSLQSCSSFGKSAGKSRNFFAPPWLSETHCNDTQKFDKTDQTISRTGTPPNSHTARTNYSTVLHCSTCHIVDSCIVSAALSTVCSFVAFLWCNYSGRCRSALWCCLCFGVLMTTLTRHTKIALNYSNMCLKSKRHATPKRVI